MCGEGIPAAVGTSTNESIVLLFNCPGGDDHLEANRNYDGRSIGEVLELRSQDWPSTILGATYIAAVKIAVTLKPGWTMHERTANVLQMVVVRCKGDFDKTIPMQAIPCRHISNPQDVMDGFSRASILVVVRNVPSPCLSHWPTRAKVSVHEVLKLGSLCEPLLRALGRAAAAQHQEVLVHSRKRKAPLKRYERELERSRELLRNVQRTANCRRILSSSSPLALSSSPLQLGYSDLEHWLESQDTCRNPKRKLDALLQSACSCGLLSWKTRSTAERCVTPFFPIGEMVPVLVHQLKELVMQRCLLGAVFCDTMGTIIDDNNHEEREDYNVIALEETNDRMKAILSNVCHRVVYILPEGALKDKMPRFATQNSSTHSTCPTASSYMQDRVLSTSLVEEGEFQLARKFEDVDKKILRLHGRVKATGKVRVLIGENVGVEHYAIAALRRYKDNVYASSAFQDYMGTHSVHLRVDQRSGPTRGITVVDVAAALSLYNVSLSTEQGAFVEKTIASTSDCLAINAVAGGGKTTVMTGMFLAMLDNLGPKDRLIFLTKSRRARENQLAVFRTYLANPFLAISLGRPCGKGSDGNTGTLWDELVDENIRQKVAPIVEKLRALVQEIRDMSPEAILQSSPFARARREKSERMHRLSVQLSAAREAAIDAALNEAKIILMTVEGYVRSLSGESLLTSILGECNFVLGCIDGAQQFEHKLVAPISLSVGRLVLMYDPVQRIERTPRNSRNAREPNAIRDGEYYPWEKCIHGGSFNPVWSTLRSEDVHHQPFTFRLGPRITTFLRETIASYRPNGRSRGIWSPAEQPHLFSVEELRSIPDTKLTCISYRNERFYSSTCQGPLLPDQYPVSPRLRTVREDRKDLSPLPIAGSRNMFANIIHEGLIFLRKLQDGCVRLNEHTDPIELDMDTKAIATIFYSNNVLVNFDTLRLNILQDPAILNAYGLNPSVPYSRVWLTGSPESVCSETVLLGQVGILPRIERSADLLGNMESEGRLVVCMTRASVETTIHACHECFQMEDVPPIWKKCAERLSATPGKDPVVDIIDARRLYHKIDSFVWLRRHLADIPQLIAKTLQAKQALKVPFCNDREDVMHAALYDDGGYLSECVDSEVTPYLNSFGVEDDGIPGGGDAKDLAQYRKFMRYRMDVSAFANTVKDTLRCLRLLPYLLCTASFIFYENSAQVVPIVLQRHPDIDAVTDMVHLQRLLWFVTVSVYKDFLGDEGAIFFVIKPNKIHDTNEQVIKECMPPHDALVVCLANDVANKISRLSYSFLGNGVPFEPEDGHSLVSRGMPIPLAERYLAVVLFFSNGSAKKEFFCSRCAANRTSDKKSMENKINKRVISVNFHLRQLRRRFGNFAKLLAAFDMTPPETIDEL